MKIALMTFHDTTNFGSFLQTYGLYKSLRDMGLECDILDYKCQAITDRELPKKKPESWKPRKIASFLLYEPKRRRKYQAFKQALAKYMTFSQVYHRDDVYKVNGLYDGFMVGSDILWDLGITGGDTAYFLDFVDERTPKFSFSTSIGKPWSDGEISKIFVYLNKFDRISVREEESKEWVERLIKKKVQSVCDPTMLVQPSYWSRMAEGSTYSKKRKDKPFVLLYFGDSTGQMMNEAKEYSNSHETDIYVINYGKPKPGVVNISPNDIEDFLWLVKNAEAVFTSSYHGFLFSLYFEKPIYYYNSNSKKHAVRFEAVINKLGIESCSRTGKKNYEEVSIDYSAVKPKIKLWRDESLEILRSYWVKADDQK